jgi:hypothetical protein
MTIHDLSKYHNLKIEIKQIKDNIEEIETTIIGSSKIAGIPITSSSNNSNPTERIGMKLAKLKTTLGNKTDKLLDELNKIEDFLNTVDDGEIRIIIRKRFIEGKTWKEVSKDIIADRSTPYYKLKKYLNSMEDAEVCQHKK